MISIGVELQTVSGDTEEKLFKFIAGYENGSIYTNDPGMGSLSEDSVRYGLAYKTVLNVSSYDHKKDVYDMDITYHGRRVHTITLRQTRFIDRNGLYISRKLIDLLNDSEMLISVKGESAEMCFVIYNLDATVYRCKEYVVMPWDTPDGEPNYFDIHKGKILYSKTKFGQYQEMKATKFLDILKTFIVGSKLDEKLVKRYIELLAEKLKSDGVFDIKVSDDPGAIYKMPTSKIESGTLGRSCMNPESDKEGRLYVDFYTVIGAKIVYILDAKGDLSARALLWENCESTDIDGNNKKFVFVDRIYGSERHQMGIIEWAEENGYYRKQEQSYHSRRLVAKGKDDIYSYRYNTGVFRSKLDGLPWLDTMYYYLRKEINTYNGANVQNFAGNIN